MASKVRRAINREAERIGEQGPPGDQSPGYVSSAPSMGLHGEIEGGLIRLRWDWPTGWGPRPIQVRGRQNAQRVAPGYDTPVTASRTKVVANDRVVSHQ
ncbi:MAG: hypothetical protein M3220_16965 [Chloroflexota bacterium]|nr:hypothetical protein [Chloroflexota bacterium]